MIPLTSFHPQANASPITVNLAALIDMSEHLATILTAESEMLRDMRLNDIAPLQAEKINLSHQIGMNQQLLQGNPALLDEADPETLAQLMEVTEALQDIIAENMRLNDIARNVNQRVVKAISDALRDQQRPVTYNRYGATPNTKNLTVSLNLNQQA